MSNDVQKRIEELKAAINPVLERYPVNKAGLFGSVIREDFEKKSDVDLLVEFDPNVKMSLMDLSSMKIDIEEVLGREVDVVEYKLIKKHLKPYILPHELRIYEKNSNSVSRGYA